jgi:hypothetical protein
MPRGLLLLAVCHFSLNAFCLGAEASVPASEISRQVDERFEHIWAVNTVKPAGLSDDATFLRRVSLDLTGRIPNVRETRAFLADRRPDKRRRLIQQLLGTPEQSAHLAREIAQAMLPNQNQGPQFEEWLFARFQAGATWGQIAANLIAPTGETQPGAALFTNILENKPEKIADATARVFLGLQMGCAECHDHPFGQWTREEFWNYSAFFADAAAGQERIIFGKERLIRERGSVAARALLIPDTNIIAKPQFPGSKEPMQTNATPDRQRLAEWMVAPENPWFAKAAVNRAWWLMLGRGLVQPVDDLTVLEGTPAQEVLELLAGDFAANNFDLKRLLEVIAGTRAYQLASHIEDSTAVRPELFHVMSVRSLTADQIYGCLMQAVAGRFATGRQVQEAGLERLLFVQSLKAPTQAAVEFQAGIPQMLTLLNGPLVARVTDSQKCDLLAALEDGPFFTDDDRIEILYLSTLTREPTEQEHKRAKTFLADRRQADSQGQELGDLLWVLLNSSECLLNH